MIKEFKVCTVCGQNLSVDNFYKSSLKFWSYCCKKCNAIRVKKWRKNNPPRCAKAAKKYHLKHKYGITPEQKDDMLKKQKNRCLICGSLPTISKFHQASNLHVDHCHKTNKVRGLLCHLCNRGLGYFKDDHKLMAKASRYLKKFSN